MARQVTDAEEDGNQQAHTGLPAEALHVRISKTLNSPVFIYQSLIGPPTPNAKL